MSVLPATRKTKTPGPCDSPLLESALEYLAATKTTRFHRNLSITLNPQSVACLNDPTTMNLEHVFATGSVNGWTPSIFRSLYPSTSALINSTSRHHVPLAAATANWQSVVAAHHQQYDPLLSSSWPSLALLAAERRRVADAPPMLPVPAPSSSLLLLQWLADRQGLVPPPS
jgi:hypothetical protein